MDSSDQASVSEEMDQSPQADIIMEDSLPNNVNVTRNEAKDSEYDAEKPFSIDYKYRICSCTKKIRRVRFEEHRKHCGPAKTCKLEKDGVVCGAKFRSEKQYVHHCR